MYKCKIHYAHHVHVYECMYLVQNIIYPYKAFCGQVQNVHSILIQCTCVGNMSSAQSTFVNYLHNKICSNKKKNQFLLKNLSLVLPMILVPYLNNPIKFQPKFIGPLKSQSQLNVTTSAHFFKCQTISSVRNAFFLSKNFVNTKDLGNAFCNSSLV